MTAAEAVKDFILTLSPVTALVSGRVWSPILPPKPTLPGVLVRQASDVKSGHLRGTSNVRWARVQIDCVALTMKAARQLDQAVLGAYVNGAATGLEHAHAFVGSPAVEILDAKPDGYQEFYDADELKQYRVMRDYRVCLAG